MKYIRLFVFPLCFIIAGCTVTRISFFEVNPQIPEPEVKLDAMTISFRSAVEDSFLIQSPAIGKTFISNFKKTLSVAFRNTFAGSFNSFSQYTNFSLEGTSIVISEMKPSWHEKSESSIGTETFVRYTYKIIVYNNGQWLREIEKQSSSIQSYGVKLNYGVTTTKNNPLIVLRNGLEVACRDIYEEVMKDLLKHSSSASGTGFLISPAGYIITNYHVVEGARTLKVKGVNGDFTEQVATLITEDKANDLALLKIKDFKEDSIPFCLRTKGLETGEDVFVLGYPLIQTMGEEVKLTKGIISSKTGFQGNNSTYQISAPVQPGNSGSPVFDIQGNLIGVANAKHRNTEGVTYVIKPSFIRTLFENAEIEMKTREKNILETLTLAQKTKILSPFIYIIINEP